MNEIVNNFLIAEEEFMPEIHLRQPGFTCSASGPFTHKLKQTGDLRYIYQNELDKACF